MFNFGLPSSLVTTLQQCGILPHAPGVANIQITPSSTSSTMPSATSISMPSASTITNIAIPVRVPLPLPTPTAIITRRIIPPSIGVDFDLPPAPTTPSTAPQLWSKVTIPSGVTINDPDKSQMGSDITLKAGIIIPEIFITPTSITFFKQICNDGVNAQNTTIYKLLGVQTSVSPPTETINWVMPTGTITKLIVGINIKYMGNLISEAYFVGLLNRAITYDPLNTVLTDDELEKLQKICVSYNFAMLKLINSIVKTDPNTLEIFEDNIDISDVECYFYYDIADGSTHMTKTLTALQMSYIMYNSNKAVDTKPKTKTVGSLIRRISHTGDVTVQACPGMDTATIQDVTAKTVEITGKRVNNYYLALTCTTQKMCQLYFNILIEFFYLIDKIAGGKHLYEFRTGSPLTQWYTGCNLGAQLGIGLGDLVEMLDIAKGNTRIYTSQTGTYAEMMRSRIVAAIALTLGYDINDPVDIANVNPLVKLFKFKIYGSNESKIRQSILNFLNIVRTLFQKSIDKINSNGIHCGDNLLLRTLFRFQPYTGWAHSLVIVCEATLITGGYQINNIYFLETYFCSTSTTIPSKNYGGPASDNPKNYPMTTFNYWLFNSKSYKNKADYANMRPVTSPGGLYYECDDIITPFIEFSVNGFIEILKLQDKNFTTFNSAANALTAQLVLIDETLLNQLFAKNCCGSIYSSSLVQTLHSGRPSLHRTATLETSTDGYTIKTPAPLLTSCTASSAPPSALGPGGGNPPRNLKKSTNADDARKERRINSEKKRSNARDDYRNDYQEQKESNSVVEIIKEINCQANLIFSIDNRESPDIEFGIDDQRNEQTDTYINDDESEMIAENEGDIDTDNSPGKMEQNTPRFSGLSHSSTDDDDELGGGYRRKRSHKRRKSTRRRRTHNKRKSVKKRHSHKKIKHNKRRTRR
jgi:hypothetical protein